MQLFVTFCICIFVFAIPIRSHAGADVVIGDLKNGWKCEQDELERQVKRIVQDDPEAYFEMGVHASKGVCYEKDDKKAFWLFMAAAQGGVVEAYYNVALMYHLGVGVKRDAAMATKMFKVLVEKDYPPAKEYICGLENPDGVDISFCTNR